MFNFITPNCPWIIVWLDWIFYCFWMELILFEVGFICHFWYNIKFHSFSGISLAMFVGFCAWVVWSALKNGYAVG